MTRCSCDTACSCQLVAGDNVVITGNGNPGTEYRISAVIPSDVDNELAVFSRDGVLTAPYVGVGRFRFPFNATIFGVSAAVNTAPTGASIILDVNKNGVSIFPVAPEPTIAIAAFDTGVSEAVPDTTGIVSGDYLTVDIEQVGSTIAGSDLTVFIRYRST